MLLERLNKITGSAIFKKAAAEVQKQTGKTPDQIVIAILGHLPEIIALIAARDLPGLVTLLLSLVNS